MEAVIKKLNDQGLLEYGSNFTAEYFRGLCGIEMPKTGTKQDFDRAALAELSAIDQVRTALLEVGRYIKSEGDAYRVLLPSENARQCSLMRNQARRKISRAKKLEQNTPVEEVKKHQTSSHSLSIHLTRSQRLAGLLG